MSFTPIQNNIRALREAKGLTQEKLAELIGIKGSMDRISMWERGFMYPHLKNFLKLGRVLGCQLEEIYPDIDALPDGPQKKARI